MITRDDAGKEIPVEKVEIAKKPYQFLWVSILREYLAFEFKPEVPLSFEWDQERVYDDFGTSWQEAIAESSASADVNVCSLIAPYHNHAAAFLMQQHC